MVSRKGQQEGAVWMLHPAWAEEELSSTGMASLPGADHLGALVRSPPACKSAGTPFIAVLDPTRLRNAVLSKCGLDSLL